MKNSGLFEVLLQTSCHQSYFQKKKKLLRKEIEMIFTCLFSFFLPPGHSCFVGKKKAQCIFCKSTMGFTCWMPKKLRKHLCNLYKEHQNKPASFFLRIIIKLIFLNLVSCFKIISKVLLKMILQYCFH